MNLRDSLAISKISCNNPKKTLHEKTENEQLVEGELIKVDLTKNDYHQVKFQIIKAGESINCRPGTFYLFYSVCIRP